MTTPDHNEVPAPAESAGPRKRPRRWWIAAYCAAELLLLPVVAHAASQLHCTVELGHVTVATYSRSNTGYAPGLSLHEFGYRRSSRMACCLRLGDWHWIVARDL